jgi:enoyl-CoA hydratase/carnithine racemase
MDIELEWHDDVAVATWNAGDNRFNPDSLGRLNEILDEVEAREGPAAFVLTGSGKFFSNGLDLDRFESAPHELGITLRLLEVLLGRILVFNTYTVCAINGHAFAGGALLSAPFDQRIMREDRGFWCLPEIDLKMPFTDGLYAGLAGHIPAPGLAEAMLTARRYSATEALAAGIITGVASEDQLLDHAIGLAQTMASKDRSLLVTSKEQLFGDLARRTGYQR